MTEPDDSAAYRLARIAVGLALTLLVIGVMLTRDVDSLQLGLVLGSILALLGIEAWRARM